MLRIPYRWLNGAGVTASETVPLGVPGPNPGVTSGLTSVTGALMERTVISLRTCGNNITNLINFANETGGTKRRKAWKRHEDVIVQLAKHLNNRRCVNKETAKLVEKIRDSFDRFRRLEKWLDASTNEDENPVTSRKIARKLQKRKTSQRRRHNPKTRMKAGILLS